MPCKFEEIQKITKPGIKQDLLDKYFPEMKMN